MAHNIRINPIRVSEKLPYTKSRKKAKAMIRVAAGKDRPPTGVNQIKIMQIMIWQAVQRILQSKEGKINSKMLGTPRALVVPIGIAIPDDVKDMSLDLGAEIIFSEKVTNGIVLSWIPVSATQIPKSIWVIFENFIPQ